MKTIETVLKDVDLSPIVSLYPDIDLTQCVFFDIETTGFSAASTTLYLIGSARYHKDDLYNSQLILHQWFADTRQEESAILNCFYESLSSCQYLFHYNGTGFDIPYLIRKAKQYEFSYNFDQFFSIDLYKQIRPFQKLLKLEKMTQKSAEQFLSITRTDTYSGKELIPIYTDYINAPSAHSLSKLLLHNREDITGMLHILPMLAYPDFFQGNFCIKNFTISPSTHEVQISIQFPSPLPKQISYGVNELYFAGNAAFGTLTISICTNELKHFYPNYHDYYYLPKEDIALHKSVASFVDKDYRVKAKAANCYGKKTGKFLPQYENLFQPSFKTSLTDKLSYFEIPDEWMNDPGLCKKYVSHILYTLIHASPIVNS